MSNATLLQQCRRPTTQTWVAALLVGLLLIVEALGATHPYDAAHASDQPCSVCVSVASLGAAAVPTPVVFDAVVVTPTLAAGVLVSLFAVAPTRRYARGPPEVSFAF
jgi:hypothetical protein